MYALGIDLGTTFTAAATWRDGRAEIAPLGGRSASIPSVVLRREDETYLTGETANRRALTEPHRVAREFKRRLGDTTPILLGGQPHSPEVLTARLLRSVVDEVVTREGGKPFAICICHPANWGPYKIELLREAVRMADLEPPVRFTTEPEAAAAFYAQGRPIPTGAVVAVYDLGGGTFDAAVLAKTATGFTILGHPEGIERLGGIDFDAAVFDHVSRAIGGRIAELDEDDPAAIASVARLREECVEAKEGLSSDTDVAIPVFLPNLTTEVRLTRTELENMVRPALYGSIEALRRALRSARVSPDELHSVLLVGGSSRMPLVAQLVAAELGRPVAVDAHPKHAIALGAAAVASGILETVEEAGARAPAVVPDDAVPATDEAELDETELDEAERDEVDRDSDREAVARGVAEHPLAEHEALAYAGPAYGRSEYAPAEYAATEQLDRLDDRVQERVLLVDEPGDLSEAARRDAGPGSGGRFGAGGRTDNRTKKVLLAAGGGVALVAAAVAGVLALTGGDGDGGGEQRSTNVSLAVARTVAVADFPDGVVADHDGVLWVASTGADVVSRIDPGTAEVTTTIETGPEPLAVAVTNDGAVWVSIRDGSAIARIDPGSSRISDQLDVASQPTAFGTGAGSLWVVAAGGNQIDRVDPEAKSVVASVDTLNPNGIAITDQAAWVTLSRANTVAKVDLTTNQVIGNIPVGRNPDALASDGEALWVTNRGDGTVSRIDLATDTVTHTIEVGTAPAGIAVDGDRIWVIDNTDGTLVLIDRLTATKVNSVDVGSKPLSLAVLGDSVWVTLSGDDTLAEVRVTEGGAQSPSTASSPSESSASS